MRLALLAVLLAGCVTASIPIPPPSASEMTFAVEVQTGTARFSYRPTARFANSVVYVFNRTVGTGIIATARDDGSVGPTEPFPAALGQDVQITFDTGETAVSNCVVVREGTPNAAESCRD